jgi:hypothetical protein
MFLVRFLAIIITGLALIAPAAHLFELPRKLVMPKDEYFVVQKIYNGWWLVGLFLPAAFLANVTLAVLAKNDATALWLAIGAAALILLNLTIFVIWTQPINKATRNWTFRQASWQAQRRQWELSHAANAGVTFLAFCAGTLAALYAQD